MRIARCTPSRGMIHSRTEAAVAEVRRRTAYYQGDWHDLYTHDLPIPDCFNVVCERAYAWNADLIWILEEDIEPATPVPTFGRMVQAIHDGADYATTTFPIGVLDAPRNASPLNFDGSGRMVWCATGCILLTRRCFELMPRPWFTLRNRLVKPHRVTWDEGLPSKYGCDIGFTFALYQLGLEGVVIQDEIRHLRVRQAGDREINDGYHVIEPLKWGAEE